MSNKISISILVLAIGFIVLIVVTSKVIFSQDFSVKDTQFVSAVNKQTMMMPGGNMTFGSSLDNAKMHLMEAIMDLNEGDVKGAIIQLNMTEQGIKMHEKEMLEMMNSMKRNLSTTVLKAQNDSS
jgi:hypothetical protein